MHLHTRNVNTAFHELVRLFAYPGEHLEDNRKFNYAVVKKPSRNGNVLMIDEPVCVTYSHPKERVLFNAARDANPFFHLYESLWMLAGRNDVDSVAYYAKQMREYSDDGETLNGAYGYRWRHAARDAEADWDCDQLNIIVNHLKADHNSRRAVLQMWNVEDDLLKIGQPNPRGEIGTYRIGDKIVPSTASKDVCCNLSVMFSLRIYPAHDVDQTAGGTHYFPERRYLDMTVTNRSNDMIWGMLGANYVHFTFLQEYVAARLGVEVGRYHHFTNNLHVYDWNWKPEEWLASESNSAFYPSAVSFNQVPLVKDPAVFERELPLFVAQYDGANTPTYNAGDWDEPFLNEVAAPVLRVFRRYKEKCPESAAGYASQIKADDWRIACTNWLQRRLK